MRSPDDVAAFRASYRRAYVRPRYLGWLHLSLTTGGALAAIILSLMSIEHPTPLELAAVPASFLIANLAEYFAHRGPMHRLVKPLSLLYERHTRRHHRFFTHQAMCAESSRDFHIVLFPPAMLLLFLGVLAAPIGALLYVAIGPNVGWAFVATAVSYFLLYEWLHLAYHLPEDSLAGRLPGMRLLRRLHTAHHDPRRMLRANFNITFPICDRLFGTYDPGNAPGEDGVRIGDRHEGSLEPR